MLGLNVADSLGVRELSGSSSMTSKHFCCSITRYNIENVNILSWRPRSTSKLLQYAKDYKNAESEQARQALFDKYGVRYKETVELPYAAQLSPPPVEPMHNQDLGLIQQYCRLWLVIDEEHSGGDGSFARMVPPPPLDEDTLQGDLRFLLNQFIDCRNSYPNYFNTNDERWWKDLLEKKMKGAPVDKYRRLWYLCRSLQLRTAGGPRWLSLYIYRISKWVNFPALAPPFPLQLTLIDGDENRQRSQSLHLPRHIITCGV
ncbi:hypothetical protein HMN09_01411000 [Mycena chlorophos]|uniref:Uncharacterized protein n=1 Tax=Mycena chlorophos TaxID=658473 RepID=A0A8H6RX16_MYCCL|nr:hypothetical protein HMN09_01411000 [Mycena chlorophos]